MSSSHVIAQTPLLIRAILGLLPLLFRLADKTSITQERIQEGAGPRWTDALYRTVAWIL